MKPQMILAAGALMLTSLVCMFSWSAPPDAKEALSPEEKLIETKGVFPKNNAWNTDISREPVDPYSARYIASIGPAKPVHPDFGPGFIGIPYQFVDKTTPTTRVKFQYANESDPGPYPIPENPKIEGRPGDKEGDRHILLIDKDQWILYELWNSEKTAGGWTAGSGAIFDLKRNPNRPQGWTSSDAAGLAVFPGLVRYEEVHIRREVTHAVRFTVVRTQHGYVAPATHYASNKHDLSLPPMGMRVRLKADYNISSFPPDVQVILIGLKKYGMILADNGSNWFISGAPDDRWDNEMLHSLAKVKGQDFEVVKMGPITTK